MARGVSPRLGLWKRSRFEHGHSSPANGPLQSREILAAIRLRVGAALPVVKHAPPPAGVPTRPQSRSDRGAIVLLGAIAALYFAREVLIPFAFALTLTFLLTPVVNLLQRLHAGRALSVLLTVLVSITLAGAIGWTIANQLVEVASQLPLYGQNIQAKIQALHTPVTGQLGKAAGSVKEIARELASAGAESTASPAARNQKTPAAAASAPKSPLSVQVVDAPASEWAELRDLSTPLLAPLGRAGIVVIFSVFMLLKKEDLRNRVLRLAGIGQLNLMTQALDDAAGRVSRYLLMQFLVNAGFGALFSIGLYWIGVPYPVLWGAVAAILRIIPYVGTLTAALLPLALSLAVFDGWLKPLLVFLLVVDLELVTANALEPWLYGAYVGISSLALLVTAIFWTVLWGPAGLISSQRLSRSAWWFWAATSPNFLSCISCWEMNLLSRRKPRSTNDCSPWINPKHSPSLTSS